MPKRIQRKRSKGWKGPGNAAYVGRCSRNNLGYGNPYEVLRQRRDGWKVSYSVFYCFSQGGPLDTFPTKEEANAFAKERYRTWINDKERLPLREQIKRELKGRDIMCWCPLENPDGSAVHCHGDVILEIANEPD